MTLTISDIIHKQPDKTGQ